MFKNLRIGMRLGLGFGVITLILTVISSLAYLRLDQLDAAIGNLLKDNSRRWSQATDMIDALNTVARTTRNALW